MAMNLGDGGESMCSVYVILSVRCLLDKSDARYVGYMDVEFRKVWAGDINLGVRSIERIFKVMRVAQLWLFISVKRVHISI